jgi:hypothetical protein
MKATVKVLGVSLTYNRVYPKYDDGIIGILAKSIKAIRSGKKCFEIHPEAYPLGGIWLYGLDGDENTYEFEIKAMNGHKIAALEYVCSAS